MRRVKCLPYALTLLIDLKNLMDIDKNIIKSCVAQNRSAQKQMYLLLLPYLRAVSARYLKDSSYVKDVLQESFVKIFKHLEDFDSNKGSLKSWSARIVINNCYNFNERIIGDSFQEFDSLEHNMICFPELLEDISDEQILSLLKQMPIGYYEVFNLFMIEGYSHEEIAKILEISEALSRKRMSRARSWVKKTFKNSSGLTQRISTTRNKIN